MILNLQFPMMRRLAALLLLLLVASFGAQMASAQTIRPNEPANVQPQAPVAATPDNDVAPLEFRAVGDEDQAETPVPGYEPLGPEWIKGQPEPGGMTFQTQYSKDGDYALWMHNAILLPLMVAISLFVLALLLWVVVRYNRRANPKPSKTTHNTLIEVVWTVIPALILLAIAIPSIRLLARQYEAPPADAVTIKATGFQWYWTYSYPDNGDFEIISNMMPEDEAIAKGFPSQLEADNRLVVPANTPLRIQTTAADVIHSFAVPSLWFKLDAVPGRLNERIMQIEEPGIYYGQCSELCGGRHAYMPIAVEALPRPQWEAWVRAQGGTIGAEEAAPVAGTPATAEETDVEAADDQTTPATT